MSLLEQISQCQQCGDYYEWFGRQKCKHLPGLIVAAIQRGR